MTERRSLQASWQRICPQITMVALLSAREVAVLVFFFFKLLVYWWSKQHWRWGCVVWIRRCKITVRSVLTEKQEAIGGLTMKEHSTYFFVVVCLFGNIFMSPSEAHPLTGSCQNRRGRGCFFGGQGVDIYATADTQKPQNCDHR